MSTQICAAPNKWENLGLPGKPAYRSEDGRFIEIAIDDIIPGLDGTPIIFETRDWMATTHAAGREICPVHFILPDKDHAKKFAFVVLPIVPARSLTLPERAKVEIVARYFSEYRTGLRLGEDITFPFVVRDSNNPEEDSNLVQPCFADEARAFQLVDILQEVFCIKATVITDNCGWLVVAESDDDNEESMNIERLMEIQGAVKVLEEYSFARDTPNHLIEEFLEAPKERQKQRERNAAPLKSFEGKLDEILLRLGRIEVKQRLFEPAAV